MLYCEKKTFSDDTARLFFGDSSLEKEISAAGNEALLRCSDGSYLNFSLDGGYIHYRNSADIRVKLPTENFGSKYAGIMLPGTIIPVYDSFYKTDSLPELSKDKALSDAKSFLEGLGISVSNEKEIYAVDHASMQRYIVSEISQYPDLTENYDTVGGFTENDDIYVIFFTLTANGIPITHRMYTDQPTNTFFDGSFAEIRIGRNGITRLDVSGVWDVIGKADTFSVLITPEKAIDKAFQEYESLNDRSEACAESIALEYIAVPSGENDGGAILIPAWDVKLKIKWDEDLYSCMMFSINAVSGEVVGRPPSE